MNSTLAESQSADMSPVHNESNDADLAQADGNEPHQDLKALEEALMDEKNAEASGTAPLEENDTVGSVCGDQLSGDKQENFEVKKCDDQSTGNEQPLKPEEGRQLDEEPDAHSVPDDEETPEKGFDRDGFYRAVFRKVMRQIMRQREKVLDDSELDMEQSGSDELDFLSDSQMNIMGLQAKAKQSRNKSSLYQSTNGTESNDQHEDLHLLEYCSTTGTTYSSLCSLAPVPVLPTWLRILSNSIIELLEVRRNFSKCTKLLELARLEKMMVWFFEINKSNHTVVAWILRQREKMLDDLEVDMEQSGADEMDLLDVDEIADGDHQEVGEIDEDQEAGEMDQVKADKLKADVSDEGDVDVKKDNSVEKGKPDVIEIGDDDDRSEDDFYLDYLPLENADHTQCFMNTIANILNSCQGVRDINLNEEIKLDLMACTTTISTKCKACGAIEMEPRISNELHSSLSISRQDTFENFYDENYGAKRREDCWKCGGKREKRTTLKAHGKYNFMMTYHEKMRFKSLDANQVFDMFDSKWRIRSFAEYFPAEEEQSEETVGTMEKKEQKE
ncbi:hypothetical protein CAEBREN_06515 [Caenorhabditis brenneri]|uniref:Uncharacterized protein n=1 Tax=Caenorhabditis brenneri TaxID=135651 RepID=G0NX06_CAEBE|nr:hypothetical protein CAEBREN_06515 [Caenorhabditis brenneri]